MQKFQLVESILLKSWHPYLWITLSSLLLYSHVIFFSEYTYYDDHFLIVENYSKIDELSDIGRQFLEDVGHQGQGGNLYRPMLNVSFILGTQISGTGLWGHFLINILLHTGSCLLLFVMLLNLGVSRSVGFISSIIFTIHPALSQSVAWISGRNDSLLAFFVLLCFISFLKFISSTSYKWYLAHLLFFAFALFTKETTIIFPLLILFYVFIVDKDKTNSVQIIGLIVTWIVVSVNWYILREAAQIAPLTSPLSVLKNLFSDLWIVFFYFGKIFYPFNLSFGPIQSDLNIFTGFISVLLLTSVIAFSQNRNWKIISFGLLWFILFLIPTFLHHIANRDLHICYYEHRIYVPMIGIVILFSSLTFLITGSRIRKIISVLLGILFVVLCFKSYCQTLHFRNYLTLRQYAAETSPHDVWMYSSIERMSLPSFLRQQVQNYVISLDTTSINNAVISDSIKRSRRTRDILEALEKKSKNDILSIELIHSLAITNYARGFFVRAEKLFLSAKILDSLNANIPYNMGILYYDAHRYKQTEQEWLLSLKLNPSFGDAYLNLASLYYEQGEFKKAWTNSQLALKNGIPVPDGLIKEIKKQTSRLQENTVSRTTE